MESKNSIFNKKETDYLINNELCRIATCSGNRPHVVPVSFIFLDGCFYFATDWNTRKYKNIVLNNNVALVVDTYINEQSKGILIEGTTKVIDKGVEFKMLYEIFYKKFRWVKDYQWNEGEAPFIKVVPVAKKSWGI